MIQIRDSGEIFSSSEARLKSLRRAFNQNHYVFLPRFLEAPLLKKLQAQIQCAQFYTEKYGSIGQDLRMRDNVALTMLYFLTNDPCLFGLIQKITGCDRIRNFTGRLCQMIPGHGHYQHWHDDFGQDRIVALSVNLSHAVYTGGTLQIRKKNSYQILHEIHNAGLGDALLFKVSPTLKHRLTPVVGKIPRTAFVGWFRSRPDFWARFRKKRTI